MARLSASRVDASCARNTGLCSSRSPGRLRSPVSWTPTSHPKPCQPRCLTPMDELWALSARSLAEGIARKQFSSTEVTRAFLERIEAYDDQLRSFITVDAER